MNILQLIDHYSAYDLWANSRLMERLSRENESILDTNVKSSFPSIRGTLMHIRNAEAVWHARMIGAVIRWPADEISAMDTVLVHVLAMRKYVQSLTMDDLTGSVAYADLKGNTHEQVRWQALMHCFNHSTYHRGQVVTMMRQLDLDDIPALDLVVYQRLQP